MGLNFLGKFAAMLVLGASLSGCIDASVDIELTSETTAKTTLTQVMGADFYAMLQMNAEDGTATGSSDFCPEGVLTENEDGSATCVLVEEGPFADLVDPELGEDDLQFTPAGPGLVRIALPTKAITEAIGAGEGEMDAETREMAQAFLSGHVFSVRIGGVEITETNMTEAEDGKSASFELEFIDLFNGTAELPDQLYAVVRAP